MEIFKILEAIEVPHAVFVSNSFMGTETYIATHMDFRSMLRSVGFICQDNHIIRVLDRNEISDFRSRSSKYAEVSNNKQGVIYERTRRPIKEYYKQSK